MGLNRKTSEHTNHSVFSVLSACLQKSSYGNLLSIGSIPIRVYSLILTTNVMVINIYADKHTKNEITTVTK